jgi:NAD(P)H-flavin reductase
MQATLRSATAPHSLIRILRLAPEREFSWRAGQYVDIAFPGFAPRPYSIAAAPDGSGELEIHIKDFGGGGAGHYAVNELQEGARVTIAGPYGDCMRTPGDTAPLLAIAGGLGITPVKAIVEDALAEENPGPVTLYWGAETEEEFYLRGHFEEMTRRNPSFDVVLVVGGEVGAVAAKQEGGGENAEALGRTNIFLAGSAQMITASIVSLLDAGADYDRIHFDRHPEAAARRAGAQEKTS